VRVKNADNADRFTATLLNTFSAQVGPPVTFQGTQGTLNAGPDEYFVQVTHQQFALKPASPAEADLYENCTVEFEKTTQPLAAQLLQPIPAPVPVSIAVPPGSRLEFTNLNTGETVIPPAAVTVTHSLRPGSYQVRVREPGWTAVRQLQFQVDAAEFGLF